MELRVRDGTTDPLYTIPEEWIKRWMFLTDYRDFVTHNPSNDRTEMGVIVDWTYTEASEVDAWLVLNELMDQLPEQKHTPLYTEPYFDESKKVLLAIDLLRRSEEVEIDCIPLSSVDKIVQFMNCRDDSYLLCTYIDSKLSYERRKEAYSQLGHYVVSHCYNICSTQYGFNLYGVTLEALWQPASTRENPELLLVREVLDKTPIFCLLGIVRSAMQKTGSSDTQTIEDEFYNINWNDVRDMVLTVSLPDYKSILVTPHITDETVRLIEHAIDFCKHNIKRGIQRMNSLRLMARLPLYTGPREKFNKYSVLSEREVYLSDVGIPNNPTDIDMLLEAISTQLDLCQPYELASIAMNHLGLDAILKRPYVRKSRPITCCIATCVRRIDAERRRKTMDVLRVASEQISLKYLHVLSKCLKLLIVYYESDAVKTRKTILSTYVDTSVDEVHLKNECKEFVWLIKTIDLLLSFVKKPSTTNKRRR